MAKGKYEYWIDVYKRQIRYRVKNENLEGMEDVISQN